MAYPALPHSHDFDFLAVRSPLRTWLLRVDEEFLCFASGYEGDQPGLLVGTPVTRKIEPEERAAETCPGSHPTTLPRG